MGSYQFGVGTIYLQPRLPDGSLGPEEKIGETTSFSIHCQSDDQRFLLDNFNLAIANGTARFTKTLSLRERRNFALVFHGGKVVGAKPSGGQRSKWLNRSRLARIAKKRRSRP
jgi:hypothetical protein